MIHSFDAQERSGLPTFAEASLSFCSRTYNGFMTQQYSKYVSAWLGKHLAKLACMQDAVACAQEGILSVTIQFTVAYLLLINPTQRLMIMAL
jgi:hypothetical protein